MISKSLNALGLIGLNPAQAWKFLSGLPWYVRDYFALKRDIQRTGSDIGFATPFPALTDKKSASGTMSGHYFHQDLLVAQRIFGAAPQKHVDIGSRVDGFVTHVASFRPIEVFDIRAVSSTVRNISFKQANLMADLPEHLHNYSDSVSCLHAIEHFGLGRYGDPIDAEGHIKGVRNLAKIVRPDGILYFSTPIGPTRIEFNAHRVFSIGYLKTLLAGYFEFVRLSYVDDMGNLHEDVSFADADVHDNFGCRFGCGIFELRRTNGR